MRLPSFFRKQPRKWVTTVPDEIFRQMSAEEQMELAMVMLSGLTHYDEDGNMVVMGGMAKFERLDRLCREMIEKYQPKKEMKKAMLYNILFLILLLLAVMALGWAMS